MASDGGETAADVERLRSLIERLTAENSDLRDANTSLR